MLVAFASIGGAQADLESTWTASRAELEARVTQLDALAASTAYSERARARASAEATRIRRRLSEGDFRIGDRIYVVIEGVAPVQIAGTPMATQDIMDTVTVLDGSRVLVRGVGEIALTGVLRSELQGRMNAAVGEIILNARATARPLVRLAVFGSVGRPGFYTIPMETRLDALVMMAGGPSVDAATTNIRMVRGDTVLLDAAEVRAAIADGTVVGAIGLREGDQLMIDRRAQPLDRQQALQLTFLFLSPVISGIVFQVFR